jgi:HD-like signal output (HDOD) protein/signal transduction histidine kinase
MVKRRFFPGKAESGTFQIVEVQQKAKLLKRITEREGLPSLSPLVIQLVELAADDRSSARDLAAVIEQDPGLTTRLLRLVGSAFFARPERVTSVSQAVVLLGFKRVRIMALSISLRDMFPMGRQGGMDYDRFWKTSLYRALIAHAFAKSAQTGDVNPEEAFISGLILEIGALMLYEVSPAEVKRAFPVGNLPLEAVISWEEANLGVNHREVGGLVFKRWRFSDQLVQSQKWFGAEALRPERPALCKVAEAARRVTEAVFGDATDFCDLQQQVENTLNMHREKVEDVLSETFERVEELAAQLRIEVNSQTDILGVMEKANQALARISTSMQSSFQGLLEHVNRYGESLSSLSEEMARGRKDILQNTLDAVAHEIRNPLLAIGGFARRLATQASAEDRGRQYAKIIAEESGRLERVLKEMLEYSQGYEPVFSEMELTGVLERVLKEFDDLFRRKRIGVFRDFPDEPVRVSGDVEGIANVIAKLLRNAIHMIGSDHGEVNMSVRSNRRTGEIFVTITDTGKPWPKEIRDALMDSNLSAKTFGSGLGLPMARRIIEAHNGRIELKDTGGGGNALSICLPTSIA